MVRIASRMDWLNGLQLHGIVLGLDCITELMHRMENPQDSYPCIHVAGSDGKGSTSAILASVLRRSGFRVGLYTSPEVMNPNERIQVDGVPIPEKEMDRLLGGIRHYAGDMDESGFTVTYFEAVTALAFKYFADRKVDIAVIEVGMGGRFDATNVVTPLVSVISNISMEHTAYLGDTISEIAFEKAGIIKPGVPCVTINTGDALDTIREVAGSKGSPLTEIDPSSVEMREIRRDGTVFAFGGREHFVSIPGRNEGKNAALALSALSLLPPGFRERVEPHIDEGMTSVEWPCRMQLFPDDVIVDVSHTVAGIQGLAEDVGACYGKVVLVLGILSDKNVDEVCRLLSGISSDVVVTEPDSPRRNPVGDTLERMRKYFPSATSEDSVAKAIEKARELRRPGEAILVTGSFVMAKEALQWMGRTSLRS